MSENGGIGQYSGTEQGNPYGAPANPYGQPTNAYGQPGNQFGQPANPYGQPANPYGQPANPYGQPANPYGQPTDPYGVGAMPPPYPAEQKASGARRLRPYLGAIIFVVVFGALAIGGMMAHKASTSARDSGTGAINKSGDLNAFQIKSGDCFQSPTATTSIASVTAIPCSQPHTSQAYGDWVFPDATALRPDDSTIQAKAGPGCDGLYTANVDDTKVPSDANQSFFVPQGLAWTEGHHDILCIVEFTSPQSVSVMK